jgi:hypothetical protein
MARTLGENRQALNLNLPAPIAAAKVLTGAPHTFPSGRELPFVALG